MNLTPHPAIFQTTNCNNPPTWQPIAQTVEALHYSRSAEVDLEEIAEYTIDAGVKAQSAAHIDELQPAER